MPFISFDESALKVGDVIKWWDGGPERTITEVTPLSKPIPSAPGCVGMATCTSVFTKSGTVQFSLWEGQTVLKKVD